MGNMENPNSIEGLVGFWDFENEYNNGYANAITTYPDARIQHYYISSNGNSVIPELHETAGYPGLTDNAYALTPQATYSVKGGVDYSIIDNNTPHNDTEIEGAVSIDNSTVTSDSEHLYGYADITFPDPGLNTYKIYTVKLNLDNIIGEDNAQYQYVYVVNIDGRIQSNVVGTENDNYIKGIYPNPFTDTLNIQPQVSDTYDIRLLDLDGREIQHNKVSAQAGQNIEIKADIAPGTYIVIVSIGNEVVASSKVIKR